MMSYEMSQSSAIQHINSKMPDLRDYFAAQALTGIISNIEHDFGDEPHKRIAEIAYSLADAMLKAREQK